ncbi:MAG: hypothetical protein HZA83_01655, partial [Thaumarchaeota archaeon]|nr:hypothetical protein [Nitrososphaerota archaeon]
MCARRRDERTKRKIHEGLASLENSDWEYAEAAFRSSEHATGLALVAFHLERYERAANKAMTALIRGPAAHELPEVALQILRLSKERLVDETITEDAIQRRKQLLSKINLILREVDWHEVNRTLKFLAEQWPSVFGPLCTPRTSKSLERRLIMSAYEILLSGNIPEAAELIIDAGLVRKDFDIAGMWALCDECLNILFHPEPGKKDRDAYWKFMALAKTTAEAVQKGVKTRERALLLAISAVNIGIVLRRLKMADYNLLTHSEQLFKAAAELPLEGKYRDHSSAQNYSACISYYLGVKANAEDNMKLACSHWEAVLAVGTNTPWAEYAATRLETLKKAEELTTRTILKTKFYKELEELQRSGELEKERALLWEMHDEVFQNPELATRLCILEHKYGGEVPLQLLKTALRHYPKNSEFINAAISCGMTHILKNAPKTAIGYFRIVENLELLSPEQLFAYGTALQYVGKLREAARIYLLSKLDKALPAAVHCFLDADERKRAVQLLMNIADAESSTHQLLCEMLPVAKILLSPSELRKFVDRILLQDASDPLALGIKKELEDKTTKELMERLLAIKNAGLYAAGVGNWKDAVSLLSQLPDTLQDNSSLLSLATGLQHLGNFADALQFYCRLPHTPETIVARAYCCLMLNRFDEAKTYIYNLIETTSGLGGEKTIYASYTSNPDLQGMIAEAHSDLEDAVQLYTHPVL